MSDKNINKTLVGAGAASAGLAGLGFTRQRFQKKVDPTQIDILAGTSSHGAGKGYTVFDTQRKAWAEELRKTIPRVYEYGVRDILYKYKPGRYPVTTSMPSAKSVAEFHVGHPGQSVIRTLINRIVKGQPQYRIFSDFGPGNLNQPEMFLGGKNWMKAPRSPIYTRNIVPGGKHFDTPKAQKRNISVTTIPTSPVFEKSKSNIRLFPRTKRVLVSSGSGVAWEKQFPIESRNFEAMSEALGKNYKVTVLGGPNISAEYDEYLKEFSKKNKQFKYIQKVDQRGVGKLYRKSDIVMMVPGSTSAEFAAMPGRKPKVIAVIPAKGQSLEHLKSNAKWLEKEIGGTVTFNMPTKATAKDYSNIFSKIEKSVNPSKKSIKIKPKEIQKIYKTVLKDFGKAQKTTRLIKRMGLAGLGVTGIGLALNSVVKK